MFNSREYAFKDMGLILGGAVFAEFSEIKFKLMRTMTEVYVSGDRRYTLQKGNKSYSGEIELTQSAVERLIATAIAAGGEDITDITVDGVVNFASKPGGKVSAYYLDNIDFPEMEMGMAQNDPNMKIKLPILIGKVRPILPTI